MATYIVLGKLTDQGIKNVKDMPNNLNRAQSPNTTNRDRAGFPSAHPPAARRFRSAGTADRRACSHRTATTTTPAQPARLG
jgi:hypothetical protein